MGDGDNRSCFRRNEELIEKDLNIFEDLRGAHGIGVQTGSATDRPKWERRKEEVDEEEVRKGVFHGVGNKTLRSYMLGDGCTVIQHI